MLLLLTQTAPADVVLDRYVAFHKSCPQMAISYTAKSGPAWVKGEGLVDSGKRLFISMKAPDLDYVASITPRQVVELDKLTQLYDEHSGEEQAYVPKSRLTGAVQMFPRWIRANDLRQILPKGVSFLISEPETIGGASCDRVVAKYSLPDHSSGVIDASIDSTGVVRRMRILAQSLMGTTDFEWAFTEMRPIRASDEPKFDVKLPVGYVPYALPSNGDPVAVDRVFPMNGWATASGKLNLGSKLGANGGLIAILGEDSPPSEAAKVALKRVASGVPVVTLADGPHAVSGLDGFDPSGKLIDAVNPPSTPFFALVDGKGKVRRLWMGYDAEKSADFEKDIRNSFSAKE